MSGVAPAARLCYKPRFKLVESWTPKTASPVRATDAPKRS